MERFRERLRAANLDAQVVRGSAFDHLVVRKPGAVSGPLHVYIEGDGTPWQTPQVPSDDPTPRTALAFELMLRDANAALYLGRPCYFGVGAQECNALVWTHERYSEDVVESMTRALDAAMGQPSPVALIGYSGGGVLAVLLSRRVPEVQTVVTVGANLDVAAWAALHRYSPLAGSMDPARLPPRPVGGPIVTERHYVGSNDRVVSAAHLRDYARGRPNVEVIEWPGFDHVCCWSDVWQDVLATIARSRSTMQ